MTGCVKEFSKNSYHPRFLSDPPLVRHIKFQNLKLAKVENKTDLEASQPDYSKQWWIGFVCVYLDVETIAFFSDRWTTRCQ